MAILIAEIILLIVLAINIPLALKKQKAFLSTCKGESRVFQDANLKKFTILFFIVLILSAYLTIQSKKYFFLLAAALMLFLLIGSVKNAMIITKEKLYFRECALPLTELTSAELTYTGKGKFMILFIMKNNHKFGYAHGKIDTPMAIAKTIQEYGIPVVDKIHKTADTNLNSTDETFSNDIDISSDNLEK